MKTKQATPAEQAGTVLEGLSHIDGTAISLAINRDGTIDRVENRDASTGTSYLAPGLIDLQINGYMGVDFSGPGLTLEGIRMATKALWQAGVTTYYPTVITSDWERLMENFAILAQAMADPEIGPSIPGLHLEGPYISPEKGFRGAHLEKYIRNPAWEEFEQLQQAAKGGIRIVTLAPEREGALPFIEKLVASGVLVSLGHHNGSADEIRLAVEAGARMSTHLGNGCANEINRHHNPLWPQLADDRLIPSLIADGYHLTQEEVRSFYKVKGPDRTILVSDALDLAGLPPGEYVRGERILLLTPHVVKLPQEDVLAGAASPISLCVGVMMDYTGCSLAEAIQMASANPAAMLSLDDRGRLAAGTRADLIRFSLVDGQMEVQATYVAGRQVYIRE